MPETVGYLLMFTAVGIAFILVNLSVGKLLRPANMNAEKGTIYECGEPTVGSAWVQFDLRFYVVALLFVIFDVEIAFFFPWAVVFGTANQLANVNLPLEQRIAATDSLIAFRTDPDKMKAYHERLRSVDAQQAAKDLEIWNRDKAWYEARLRDPPDRWSEAQLSSWREAYEKMNSGPPPSRTLGQMAVQTDSERAFQLAWVAFFDIVFFFGVLIVGFAYLWRRGDLNWVRSLAAQKEG